MEDKKTDLAEKASVATQKAAAGKLVYIGPNIPKLGLTQYQVYIWGVPAFSDIVNDDQKARIARLFIPIARLSQAMTEIEVKGTAYNTYYNDGIAVRKEIN